MPPLPQLCDTEGLRYLALAAMIESNIRNGTYRAGDRLPSIRQLHSRTKFSISTVYQAMIELEKRGLVDPRPKSGYYVKPLIENVLPTPQTRLPRIKPSKVTINNLAFAVMEAMGDPQILQLGGSVMATELMPVKALARTIKSIAVNKLAAMMAVYENPMGHMGLRRYIVRHSMEILQGVSPEEILITNGCFEAVALCLQAVAGKGDIIVVESPTFPWYLQLIEDLHMLALEIPTDPKEGIDLVALEHALDANPVKACIFNSNFQNPLGFLPSVEKKRALVMLLNAKAIPVIEDDIYGELYFGASRPAPLKSFDTKELVLYCSSFSKTLSPGLRVGWCIPGAFLEKVKRLKLYVSISSPTITQEILHQFLQNENFDRHLRKLRAILQRQMADMALAIARYFPEGTRISTPQGGLTLWVQFNECIDSLRLFRRALDEKIAVLPGVICANTDAYRHCIRISCGLPYDERVDRGLQTLAGIVNTF